MKNLSSLFTCLILAGCITSKRSVNFAGDDFNHTGSLCMDALLVNMDKDNCVSPIIKPESGHVLIECKNTTESFWNSNVFLLVPGMQAVRYEIPPVCMDFNYALFLYLPKNHQEK